MTDTFPVSFGRYQLVERLAVGGMAELFKARVVGSHGFQKAVVIKKILPHLAADASFVAMFIDEAKITARLDHPKIAQVLELGTIEEQLYIAMELVDGLDALAVLRACAHKKQTLPAPIAVHVAHEVLDALDYAHAALDDDGRALGIVHRDISPSNVLISRRGDVKLADFGIAHAVERQQKTQAGTLKGKYGYMSPEQVLGADIDCRSDLFSVGIVLAEMLMGRRLFTSPNELDVLLMVRDVKLDRLDKYGAGIDADLRAIMNTAFARDPKNRFQSAREFRDVLSEYLFTKRQRVQPRDLAQLIEMLIGPDQPKPAIADAGSTSAPHVRPPTATLVGPATKAKELQAAEAARVGREQAAKTPAPARLPEIADLEPPAPAAPAVVERPPRAATTPLRAPDATPRSAPAAHAAPTAPARQTILPPAPVGLVAPSRQSRPPTPKPPPANSSSPPAGAAQSVAASASPTPSVRRPAAPPVPATSSPLPDLGLHADADIDAQIDAALAQIAPMEMSSPPTGGGRSSTEIPIVLDLSDNAPVIPMGEGVDLSGPTLTIEHPPPETDFSDLSLDLEIDDRAAARRSQPRVEVPATPVEAPPRPQPVAPAARAGEAPDEEGDLATTPAIRTLYRLAVEKSSGLLVVEVGNPAAGGIIKEIFFAGGAPEYVSSNVARELLGEYLVSQKVISAGELAMALAMMPHFGGKLGDTLVGLGLMKPLDVFRHLTRQVRDKIIDVCTWQKGHYRWFRGKRNAREAFPLGLDAFEVLGAGATALPFEAVEAWAGHLLEQTPIAAKNPRVVPEAFRLGAFPRDVYNRLDGRMTLGAFLQRFTNVDDRLAFLRTLYLLVQSDLAYWQ